MVPYAHVRTAVIGCGYWGKNLVRNFAALSDLRACCDVSRDVRERLAREYPGVVVTASYAEVLDRSDIDAVVLVTPSVQHASMAIEALEAGKHVYVEKPLAVTIAGAEAVVAAADRAGRILMVGHLLEYHPAVEQIKALIDRGELGEVFYLYSQRLNLGKIRSNENALWSLAPHDISVILYLLGEEPEDVDATGRAFLQNDIEDVVFVALRFSSGRMAHVHVSWLDPHKERRLTVVGSKKMVGFDDMQLREKIRIHDKGVDRHSGDASEYASYGELLTLREGDILLPRVNNQEPLTLECTEFLRSVATGVPPRADGRDGLRVVRVLEAAQERLDMRRAARFAVTP